MNNVEKFLSVAGKARDCNAETLTMAEKNFLQILENSQCKARISKTNDKKDVLLWDSSTGETIACCINKDGFLFSEVKIYDKKNKTVAYNATFHFLYEKTDLVSLEEEIETIKTLLMLYSEDMKNYFK
jgi:hypothetical protein